MLEDRMGMDFQHRAINFNVGIGPTSPQAKLDINGKIAVRGGPSFESDWVVLSDHGTVTFTHNLGYIPFCMVRQDHENLVASINDITATTVTLKDWCPGVGGGHNVKVYCW